jgi:hypothetical protein
VVFQGSSVEPELCSKLQLVIAQLVCDVKPITPMSSSIVDLTIRKGEVTKGQLDVSQGPLPTKGNCDFLSSGQRAS